MCTEVRLRAQYRKLNSDRQPAILRLHRRESGVIGDIGKLLRNASRKSGADGTEMATGLPGGALMP